MSSWESWRQKGGKSVGIQLGSGPDEVGGSEGLRLACTDSEEANFDESLEAEAHELMEALGVGVDDEDGDDLPTTNSI